MARSKTASFLSRVMRSTIIFMAVVILLIVVLNFAFRINKIEVVGVDSQWFLQTQLAFLYDQSLLFTNFEQTPLFTDAIKNKTGQIFIPIAITKKLPSTLQIEFKQENPRYRLLWQNQSYLVNSIDFLGENNDSANLATVQLSDKYAGLIQKNTIDSHLNQTIQSLLDQLASQQLQPDEIRLNQHQSQLQFNQTKFIFEDTTDFTLLAAKVKAIISNLDQIKQELGTFDEIDVRFDLPVVRGSALDAVVIEDADLTQAASDSADTAASAGGSLQD